MSVTMLDTWRYYQSAEDMTLEALVKRLRGEEPPTEQMLAGRAFHSVLEHAQDGSFETATADGFGFSFAMDGELALPAVRELKGEMVIETDSGLVTLVGMVDAMDGLTVRDYKLTERFDAEKYQDSLQWRAYLMMFGARRFIYDVFQARYDGRRVCVYDYQALPLCAYPAMAEDVRRAVSELAPVLARYVPERVTPDEVAA